MAIYMANKKRIDDIITGRAQNERRLMPRKRQGGQRRVGVNAVFLGQLRQLLPICVPGKGFIIDHQLIMQTFRGFF